MFLTDAAEDSSPHRRRPRNLSAAHSDQAIPPHNARQGLTNAADTQQRSHCRRKSGSSSIVCAMASSTASSWLAKCAIVTSARDCATALTMLLFLRFFHCVRPAIMPARIVCNPPNVRRVFEGGLQSWGLNNSQYSRMCDASTPSVLLRPNLVRAKSRICAGLTVLTTWPASCSAHATPRLSALWIPDRRELVGSSG
jgi:hypothetical protein